MKEPEWGRKKPELLVPASCLEVLKVAVHFGADAVYIGGEVFNLRAKAKNFSLPDMQEGISYAHAHGVRVYVTVNIFAHNSDLDEFADYLVELKGLEPDALIISDPGIFSIARRICPEIPIHISTQANNTNYETFCFWYDLGAKRVVTARELSMEEIKQIRRHIPEDMEIETFVHGSMCISYSGRCLLSNFLAGRDANQGACTHPCRWNYALVEETRPGEYFPIGEEERGSYILNSKDLCMIEHIPDLVEAGIDSFKIEGRMKTALYVADVTRSYRRALDDYYQDPSLYEKNLPLYRTEIAKGTYRPYTTGFFYGKPTQEAQIYDESTYIREYTYLGRVSGKNQKGMLELEQRNKFCVGDEIEIMRPNGQDLSARVEAMEDEEGMPMESCPHPKQTFYVRLAVDAFDANKSGTDVADGDLLRRPTDPASLTNP